MSMMMPPDPGAAPGLPLPPGAAGAGPEAGPGAMPPPMDALNAGPMPGEGGIQALLAALGGGGEGPPGAPPEEEEEMDPVDHIRQAMKHLMMAMAMDEDEERGHGIVKGMGALQGILGGEQKKNAQLAQLGG
jgi:hypothetical protein